MSISLRTFRAVVSGQMPPSLRFFSKLFPLLPHHLRKNAVLAYFETSLEACSGGKELLDYFDQELSVSMRQQISTIWTRGSANMLSEDQLKYLSSETEVLRLYHRLIIFDGVKHSELRTKNDLEIMENLVRIKLAKKNAKNYFRLNNAYSLPHQDNSPKEMVSLASEFIFKHVDAFLAKEGAPGEQEIGYTIYTCRKRDVEKILEQMRIFKKWVASFGVDTDEPDEVAFVWVNFARVLFKDRDF